MPREVPSATTTARDTASASLASPDDTATTVHKPRTSVDYSTVREYVSGINYCKEPIDGFPFPATQGADICGLHGTCDSRRSGSICHCHRGWTGTHCQHSKLLYLSILHTQPISSASPSSQQQDHHRRQAMHTPDDRQSDGFGPHYLSRTKHPMSHRQLGLRLPQPQLHTAYRMVRPCRTDPFSAPSAAIKHQLSHDFLLFIPALLLQPLALLVCDIESTRICLVLHSKRNEQQHTYIVRFAH